MEERFNEVFNLYSNYIYRYVINIGINKHDAEDIVQKTFYKLYNNKKILIKDNKEIKKWLYKISINEAKDLIKSPWYKKKIKSDEILENYSKTTKQSVLLEELLNIEPIYRTTLYLYYYEGYSIKEISLIIKKSESAVKMRLSRGKEILRKEMEDNGQIRKSI